MMTCNDEVCKKCCFKHLLDNNVWHCVAHDIVFFGTRGEHCQNGPLLKNNILKDTKNEDSRE